MHKPPNLENKDRFVYVGSASRFGLGLDARISDHINASYRARPRNTGLLDFIRLNELRYSRNFITLMTAEIATSKSVLEVRQRVVPAEGVMTVWLRALISRHPYNDSLHQMYP